MRKVIVSQSVQDMIADVENFLTQEYHMSRTAAMARTRRMYDAVMTLRYPIDTALCRFRRWRELGYRCVAFDGWVFAYKTVSEGVIVRDMAHGSVLEEVTH